MSSEAAATYLLEHHPRGTWDGPSVVRVIRGLSWRRPDQMRLARHYLSNLPHAHEHAYKAFASFMSVPRFLRVIEENLPQAEDRMGLLFYYLTPVLRDAARTESDRRAVKDFLRRHSPYWRERH